VKHSKTKLEWQLFTLQDFVSIFCSYFSGCLDVTHVCYKLSTA